MSKNSKSVGRSTGGISKKRTKRNDAPFLGKTSSSIQVQGSFKKLSATEREGMISELLGNDTSYSPPSPRKRNSPARKGYSSRVKNERKSSAKGDRSKSPPNEKYMVYRGNRKTGGGSKIHTGGIGNLFSSDGSLATEEEMSDEKLKELIVFKPMDLWLAQYEQRKMNWPENVDSVRVAKLLKANDGRYELGTRGLDWKQQYYNHYDSSIRWYRSHLSKVEHLHFIVIEPEHAILSIEKEAKYKSNGHLVHRVLLWGPKGEDRLVVREGNMKDILQGIVDAHPMFTKPAVINQVSNGAKLSTALVALEEKKIALHNKFGVLITKAGQTTEDEWYRNHEVTPELKEFLYILGNPVKLLGFEGYSGGLDTTSTANGEFSYYTLFKGREIMFHVAPLIPITEQDTQGVNRKKYLGNDVCMIIFRQPGGKQAPFDPDAISSHFNHVFIIVEPVYKEGMSVTYKVAVAYKHGVKPYYPILTYPAVYSKGFNLRLFILSKLVNGEPASLHSPEFLSSLRRTNRTYLSKIAEAHPSKSYLKNVTKK